MIFTVYISFLYNSIVTDHQFIPANLVDFADWSFISLNKDVIIIIIIIIITWKSNSFQHGPANYVYLITYMYNV